MSPASITLLVEDLSRLAAALPSGQRYPVLEGIMARGKHRRVPAETPNHLRYRLFGLEPSGHLPVAALTHVSSTGVVPEAGSFWLRADPVTMQADMTRVFMTACGFGGFEPAEREALSSLVRSALTGEGFELPQAQSPWCFRLDRALEFEFTPLHQALGLDMAEALPVHPNARNWKRIMTDIQVELHQCEVNERRRANGQQEVNSVWFWGGGSMPDKVARVFDTVVSNDPVSRGLGVLSGTGVQSPDNWEPGEGRLLIDWEMPTPDALNEADSIEAVAARLVDISTRSGRSLDLLDGSGEAWRFEGGARFRFWKRREPLADTFRRLGAR